MAEKFIPPPPVKQTPAKAQAELVAVLEKLCDAVTTLILAVDGLQEEIEWVNNQKKEK